MDASGFGAIPPYLGGYRRTAGNERRRGASSKEPRLFFLWRLP